MSELHIDSLSKSYNNKVILSDVFLTCKTGEIKGLIGRNGSGKSTLLKIVFGVEQADFKYVKVDNKIVENLSEGRRLINYLPQDNFLPNGVKIKTLINLFLPKQSRTVLLENEHVKPLLNRENKELSTGQKRIVEILLVIHSNAKFILLDEPFNGVSPIFKKYIMTYILEMKSSKGFIITDHDYENVLNLADSNYFLKNGYLKEIVSEGELVELGYITKSAYTKVSN
ncbi:ABC-type lipopolysaccharide export system ATPase subunit [Winogradskyella epiphytica]|uniref:ABC-type lipopolysaccharide export system ATPase subunit n=1 Tax=Winogradskyella epiphytica TaxID=262005 RepID=A0A2V4X0J0_9FLAO|nr:ATP-binding cassette domain-containing protein [Winogradskyella epiphytica]PYE83188.1 ABC-type lipopolysaccharide export system ATPase subunit [Winogradskyella epiphytica]GGW56457.1 ABC transporter ATP-binding protein [Winogradskyella epiphytica]